MRILSSLFFLLVLIGLTACSKSDEENEPQVTVPIALGHDVRATIGDSVQSYQVLGSEKLLNAIAAKEMKAVGKTKVRPNSLNVSFPKKIGRAHV